MEFRIEKDSMGEVQVPPMRFIGAQTQRAVENFPISGIAFPRLSALWRSLKRRRRAPMPIWKLLDAEKAEAIEKAAQKVAEGHYDHQFPDRYFPDRQRHLDQHERQRSDRRASQKEGVKIHPNDDVNNGQSTNDVIPAAIHVAAAMEIHDNLLPALRHLPDALRSAQPKPTTW